MTKSKTFSLYLAKEEVKSFEEILSDTAKAEIKAKPAMILEANTLGSKARAYLFVNPPKPPGWLKDLEMAFDGVPFIENKSSSSVVIFCCSKRIFATTFSYGWQFIDDSKVEPDFGLRVAINSLGDSTLKRIDRSHLGEAIKGVAQSAFQRDLQAFGVDEALDLVRRISGTMNDGDFANSLAGATSLKLSGEFTLLDMPGAANDALTRFSSDAYKKTGFKIIDKVRPVLDQSLVARLDAKAVENIASGEDSFELSMPGWSDDDIVYYGFIGLRKSERFPDLLMKNYRDTLGPDIAALDVDLIANKHGVLAEFGNENLGKKRWSIKKALVGSVILDKGLFAINEGAWYRLDEIFKQDIDKSFHETVLPWTSTPEKLIKKVSPNNRKTAYESELEYNRRCAKKYNQICLDQEILTVPSIPYGKFEACDLLDIANKRLIHVKKSSRQSSVLSHFFKQGANSARLLKTFPEAGEELVNKVKDITDAATASSLKTELKASLAGWTIEFHIIDAPRPDGSFAIPFFSRITLREERRTLRGMNYFVALRFI